MTSRYWLVALWLGLSVLIALLTWINVNHYLSIDSQYYLSMAGWLVGLDGDQYGHPATGWDSTFPVGYPALIGGLAYLTDTSLLVASKLLNSLLVGGFVIVWQRRMGSTAVLWMGSVLLLGGFLRILAYTWSEWAFLFMLLEWMWTFRQTDLEITTYAITRSYGVSKNPAVGKLLLLTIALFLLRYVGGFVVIVYGLRAITTYWRGGWRVVRERFVGDLLYTGLSITFMLGYFWLNNFLTASPYGGERFVTTDETFGQKLFIMGLAPLNEILLIRDYVIGEPNALVWLGLFLQIVLFWWLWHIVRSNQLTFALSSLPEKQFFTLWLWVSATYLIGLYTMRWFSPFSGPNARMMSVVTLPFLMGVANWVGGQPNALTRRKLARWWVILLLCSWLQLLPQADFWEKMAKLLARV